MTDTVRCRTVDGTQHILGLTVIGTIPTAGTLPARLVTVDGQPLIQKWVPRTDSGKPGPLDQLDREILATYRFAQLFPPDTYPRELPRLRYYDVDSEDPFILLTNYRGVPVTDALPHMTAPDRHRLQVGLLRALHYVSMAGMTHGRVDHDVLRWDAETRSVQLVDFEHASPADIRHDMRNAGLAVWRTAHPEHVASEAPDLDTDNSTLRALLADVFVDPPNRPTPADLLTRLREPTRIHVIDLAAQLQPGVRAFDSAAERKRDRHTENRPAHWWSRFRLTKSRPPPTLVRCPVCLDSYLPSDDGLWRRDEHGKYHQLEPAPRDPLKNELDLVNSYRRCPNPSQDSAEHFLPANYFAYDPPLVVALVGQPTAGKTHLLAAMIREAVERNGLAPHGLTVVPMDLHLHDSYRTSILEPAARGEQLPETPARLTDPANILLIRGRHSIRPLVLFDVAGEDLQAVSNGDLARFVAGTNAVIFVHGLEPMPSRDGKPALETSLARFQAVSNHHRLPAAIVVTKADRLRYQPPVSRWLHHDNDGIEPQRIRLESRDVYAFLHHRQEHAALTPFSVFDRCTLHFATASGSDADNGTFRLRLRAITCAGTPDRHPRHGRPARGRPTPGGRYLTDVTANDLRRSVLSPCETARRPAVLRRVTTDLMTYRSVALEVRPRCRPPDRILQWRRRDACTNGVVVSIPRQHAAMASAARTSPNQATAVGSQARMACGGGFAMAATAPARSPSVPWPTCAAPPPPIPPASY